MLVWEVQSCPCGGQGTVSELRWKDSLSIVILSGESFNTQPMSMFLYSYTEYLDICELFVSSPQGLFSIIPGIKCVQA